jgi:acyl-homoserine-lactone acylase
MKFLFFFFLLVPLVLCAQPTKEEISRWQKQAKNVTIIRDNWGIPHIYGKSDADAVFGLMYAQCEDDFDRVAMNYAEKLGVLSTIKGESKLYDDLLNRIVLDQDAAQEDYKKAPLWLKKLCESFADGINYYLYKHPEVKSPLGRNFQPWYPLLWTDGSIGAINTADVSVNDLKNFYGGADAAFSLTANDEPEENATGSNGFAFSPSITESGNAILYINPHVTFYFRPEVHVVSDEGLNVYGAVTWGQFFVYQGFNEHCGWMHTSSAVDAADSYIEKLVQKNGKWFYEYDNKLRPVMIKKVSIRQQSSTGANETRVFTVLYTHHGPVMAKKDGQYISVRADNRIMNGLIQCWQRNKTKSFADYKKTMDLTGNISNNTVYADAEGNIAYWHGNRVPVRDLKYNWNKPVDGSLPSTEWKGIHRVDETVHLINPSNGWLQNCNSTPYTVAGPNSPKKTDFPFYMAPDGENFRGLNAVRVLSAKKKYNINDVISVGYDTRITAFELLVPALVTAFEKTILYSDSLYAWLIGPISVLKYWDYRCGENSIATTLAVEWAQKVWPLISRTKIIENENADQVDKARFFASSASAEDLIKPFLQTIDDLDKRFGKWQIPWGRLNRFQRISADIEDRFDDARPSLPVGFVSSTWGMLPSFVSRPYPGTTKRYGYNGNSFVCAVEFGKKIRAKSLLTGGQSGNPASPHFTDQALMYTKGQFKDVLFYREDVIKHAERTYHPGE